ncbi:hypothetical protein [Kibdelosporangium philippinense]|uniref:hypothetical protein n=1 Tax=Kibdelosporangium philippinense TaxID=211113 RepID=UPI0036167ACC
MPGYDRPKALASASPTMPQLSAMRPWNPTNPKKPRDEEEKWSSPPPHPVPPQGYLAHVERSRQPRAKPPIPGQIGSQTGI